MSIKKESSKFNPKIWQVQSKIVKEKSLEIQQDIEAVLNKYNEKLDEIQTNINENENKP